MRKGAINMLHKVSCKMLKNPDPYASHIWRRSAARLHCLVPDSGGKEAKEDMGQQKDVHKNDSYTQIVEIDVEIDV